MKRQPYNGRSSLAEYKIWSAMKRRCTRQNATDYPRYGGRGITVCESWMSFDGFLADMGRRPSDQHTLERIDNEEGCYPGNCRWATLTEQNNNTRRNHFVEYRGERMTIAQATRAAGGVVLRETARNRIAVRGWPVERAVETPNTYRRDPETRCVIRTAE